MPPRRYKRRRRDVPIAPRIPVAVHLMPEADDNRVAKVTDAAGIATEVNVVGTGGDRRDRRVGGVDLHVGNNAVSVDSSRERGREWLRPATVIAGQVRLLA